MLLSTDVGHFSLVQALHLADLITLMNGNFIHSRAFLRRRGDGRSKADSHHCGIGFCGVMSIFSSLRYTLGDADKVNDLWLALWFLPFGFFFDAFDGKVARWRKKSSLMGQELDSLADLVRIAFTNMISPYHGVLVSFQEGSLANGGGCLRSPSA